MAYIIPIQAIPNQQFEVLLAEQDCTINLYQRGEHVYMNLYVEQTPVIQGAICYDRQNIINRAQNLFDGALMFIDSRGNSDPQCDELGDRYELFYLSTEELAELEALQS